MISTLLHFLAEGFFLGLTLGTTCAATCGPMYMPYLMQREQSVSKSIINIFEISAGRFISYVTFGVFAGVLGSSVGMVIDRGWFSSVAYILFAVLLLISTFRTHQKHKGCSVSKWSKFADRPFLFGIMTGISLCPSFFGAMTAAFDAGGSIGGGAIFAGFFFGSSIFLMPFMLAGLAGNVKLFQKIAIYASVIVAAYFIGKGVIGLTELIQEHSKTSPISASNVVNAFDEQPLVIIDTTQGVEILTKTIAQARPGVTTLSADTLNLPMSGTILVAANYLDDPTLLRSPQRFVVVLPRNDGTLTDQQYALEMRDYLGKYLFKKDEIHGTFLNMAAFLEKNNQPTTETTK